MAQRCCHVPVSALWRRTSMSFADSQVYSSETLAAGEETLALQGVKLENMDDRESMEKELKDNLNQTYPKCHLKIIYHFVAH